MNRLRLLLPVATVFCLALLIRVVYNITVAEYYYPLHDALFYQTIGFNMLKEHCFCLHPYIPTVERAPLWPLIIALISIPLGTSDFFVRLLLCVLGSGTCVMVYLFARDSFGERVGIWAGGVAAIYPGLYIYDGWLYSESLYTFLLFALCYAVYRLQREPKRSKWICCGILLGLLSLTRPNGLLVIGLFILWTVMMGWTKILSWSALIKNVLLSIIIALAIIAPWTVRNYNVSHTFIPVAVGDGSVLLGAYNDAILTKQAYIGSWLNPLQSSPTIAKSFPLYTCAAPCEVTQEAVYREHAEQWIQNHIPTMPYLLTLHFINMGQPTAPEADMPMYRFPNQISSQIVLNMTRIFPIIISILAALGIIATRRQWQKLLFIYLLILLTILECLLFYGSPRFRAPIEPMLVVLAAGAIWGLAHRASRTKKG